jgi:CRP-like cAMP-binding protein
MPRRRGRSEALPDLQLMRRLRCLAWLSAAQLQRLHDSMSARSVEPGEVICREQGRPSPDTHILLLGTAQLNYISAPRSRAVAILPPGVVFQFPLMPIEVAPGFELVALAKCRVAAVPTDQFIRITLGIASDDYTKIRGTLENHLGGVLARYTNFVGLSMERRVVLALLELSRDFGVADARGSLLRITFTHQQLADLAGASRARVTKALLNLDGERVITRQGRQLILDLSKARALLSSRRGLAKAIGPPTS